MVRLKREIDGIRIDRSVPEPTYTLHPRGAIEALPTFDRQVQGVEGARVLVAGAPQITLAVALAEAGRHVTLTDLQSRDVPRIHAALSPEAAGRMNLVDKLYGETTFAPSAFDAIVWLDMLHAYPAPQWLVHKLHRELKIDGLLHARLLVRGPLPEVATGHDAPTPSPSERRAMVAAQALTAAGEVLAHHKLAALLHNRRGREAVDRGAHLSPRAIATGAAAQLDAVAFRLRIEDVQVGHTLRRRLASLLFGLRPPAARVALACLAALPELADAEDRDRTLPRVISVIARKSLADMGRIRGRRSFSSTR